MNNLIGLRFGRLVVVGHHGQDKHKNNKWNCVCDCGGVSISSTHSLKSGDAKSCGCYGSEQRVKSLTTHGACKTSGYKIYRGMIRRCTKPTTKNYKYYGGKGIKVCDRWLNSFENFYTDMGDRPSKNHSLDRYPNKNGNYEPGNVRWATDGEQTRNKSNNKWIVYNGESKILSDWAKKLNITQSTLKRRLSLMSVEDAITKPKGTRSIYRIKGQDKLWMKIADMLMDQDVAIKERWVKYVQEFYLIYKR